MAGKPSTGGAVQTMADGLNEAAEGIAHAMMAPDAGPHVEGLTKLLTVIHQMAHGGKPPGQNGGPGAPGTPGAPGAGPPGGGAANPAMPSMNGGGTPPGPPLMGGATQGPPQLGGDELRRQIAMATADQGS